MSRPGAIPLSGCRAWARNQQGRSSDFSPGAGSDSSGQYGQEAGSGVNYLKVEDAAAGEIPGSLAEDSVGAAGRKHDAQNACPGRGGTASAKKKGKSSRKPVFTRKKEKKRN